MKKYTLAFIGIILSFSSYAYDGRIDGDFNGWEGDTIYKLMDGHIIQQSSYHYHYHYSFSPEVHIYKDKSGYVIFVEGDNSEPVHVKFLK